jgi:hypothetical protein
MADSQKKLSGTSQQRLTTPAKPLTGTAMQPHATKQLAGSALRAPAQAQGSGMWIVRDASGRMVERRSLADPEVAARIAEMRAQITSSPEESVKFLKQVGVLNRSGKLAKKFGG